MTAFGLSPLGTSTGPFGGPGLITVLAVLPIGNNRLVVIYDVPPRADDRGAAKSATNPQTYELRAVDPTYTSPTTPAPGIVPRGAVVPTRAPTIVDATQDEVDPGQIVLTTDCLLEPHITYELELVRPPCGGSGESFAGPTEFRFRAVQRPPVPREVELVEEKYRDFDYVFAPADGETGGAYRHEANGDIGLQAADASLRKRIYRRFFSGRGAFAVLSKGYGVGVRDKSLVTPGQMQELASQAAEQIRSEPDVQAAAVEAQLQRFPTGTLVQITAHVRRTDGRTVRFQFGRTVGG